jgi:hypothetical protein
MLMKLKILLILLALVAVAHAETVQGDIYAVDAKANTIVISAKGTFHTFRVRPNTEITINGVKAKLATLTTAMTAKVVSSEPTVANSIAANGAPDASPSSGPAALVGGAVSAGSLESKLSDSHWRLQNGKTFTLHTDGKTTANWHGRKGSWKVTGVSTAELELSFKGDNPPVKATFNPDATIASWGVGKERTVAKRFQP